MEKLSKEDIIDKYKPGMEQLIKYLPYLEEKAGQDAAHLYEGKEFGTTFPFPVYDARFLEFLDELGSSIFMDRNYRYIYSRYRIKDTQDELEWIEKTDIMNIEVLSGILSKYTLGGLTKAYLWSTGMTNQIFYKALCRAKKLLDC